MIKGLAIHVDKGFGEGAGSVEIIVAANDPGQMPKGRNEPEPIDRRAVPACGFYSPWRTSNVGSSFWGGH